MSRHWHQRIDACRTYLGVILGLFGDSIHVLRWRGFLGSGLVLLGALLQLGVLGIVLFYASWLETNELREYFGFAWVPRESSVLLAWVAGVSAVALIFAAVIRWFGAIGMINCRIRFERACTLGVLERAVERLRVPGMEDETGRIPAGRLMATARRDARYAGRSVVSGYMAIPVAILSIGAAAGLFWIAPLLTAVLVPLFVIAAVAVTRIGRHGAEASRRLEEEQPEATRVLRQVIRGESEPAEACKAPEVESAFRAYARRLQATSHSHLVSDGMLAVLVVVILVALGPGGPWGTDGWEQLLAYLILLRVLQANLRQLAGRITGINRFYPQLSRLHRAMEIDSAEVPQVPTEPWLLRVRDDLGSPVVTLAPGSRIAVLYPHRLDPLQAGSLARGIAANPVKARQLLNTMVVASSGIEDAITRARATGRWVILVDAESLDPAAVLPPADDLAFVTVQHQDWEATPMFGESMVVLVDDSREHGPLAMAEFGANIDAARIAQASKASSGLGQAPLELEEDDDDD